MRLLAHSFRIRLLLRWIVSHIDPTLAKCETVPIRRPPDAENMRDASTSSPLVPTASDFLRSAPNQLALPREEPDTPAPDTNLNGETSRARSASLSTVLASSPTLTSRDELLASSATQQTQALLLHLSEPKPCHILDPKGVPPRSPGLIARDLPWVAHQQFQNPVGVPEKHPAVNLKRTSKPPAPCYTSPLWMASMKFRSAQFLSGESSIHASTKDSEICATTVMPPAGLALSTGKTIHTIVTC
jgi:hypothetical protein